MHIKFTKMHGLGNDFVVVDLVTQKFNFTPELIRQLSDRQFGVGFDQMLIVEPPSHPEVDFSYRIFNADGSEVEQCGNGIRCFARFVNERKLTRKSNLLVETKSGIVQPTLLDHGWVRVNMGKPRFHPTELPMLLNEDQLYYSHSFANFNASFSIVNMGNPHVVLRVPSIMTAPVQELGSLIEKDALFPERVNVGFMEVISPLEIKLRVFERGTGETKACGTGACAAVVAGVRQGLLAAGKEISVHLTGGSLKISWKPDDDVWMTGPTANVYEGTFDASQI